MPPLKWTTKDGKRVFVRDMSDNHLLNTMRFLIRRAEAERMATILFYSNASSPRGDMAMDCFEREEEAALEASFWDYIPEIWTTMDNQRLKRGLPTVEFPCGQSM